MKLDRIKFLSFKKELKTIALCTITVATVGFLHNTAQHLEFDSRPPFVSLMGPIRKKTVTLNLLQYFRSTYKHEESQRQEYKQLLIRRGGSTLLYVPFANTLVISDCVARQINQKGLSEFVKQQRPKAEQSFQSLRPSQISTLLGVQKGKGLKLTELLLLRDLLTPQPREQFASCRQKGQLFGSSFDSDD